jgi:hypothetical protein
MKRTAADSTQQEETEMEFTRKDVLASALVVAVVLAYASYLAFGEVPFIEDARGMAAVGLILGFASRRIGGRSAFEHERAAFAAGLGSMALGVAALATENDVLVGLFVTSIVALWVAAMYTRSARRRRLAVGAPRRVSVSH